MSASSVTRLATSEMPGIAHRRRRFARLRRMRLAGVGAVILLLVVAVAVAAPWIAPYDPAKVNLIDRLKPPLSPGHLLGTDSLGQDVLSRLIYGARVSTLVGFLAVAIAGTLGVTLGLLSGYYGGWLDDIIMRIAEIQLAFPTIILYVAVMAVLGPGLMKVIAVIGVVGWVQYGRMERGMVLSVRQQEYVEAARALGARDRVLLIRHILPNTLGPMMVVASFGLATTIITEASLSFLGLGVPPSVPSWGSMLADGRDYLRSGWWVATFPGIAITLTVLAINLLGDWLRDELDPLLKVQ
ncbi:MAG TPA: ABC transporter permease [Chloroflexota bacterium]|nr:ABC transporter permease [Chloroflexota bacterium]